MKKIVFFFLAIAFQTTLFGQNVSVPYRVGNKFGISDQNGKMFIEPQFDIVELSGINENCFQAFIFQNNLVFSNFIYNNKVILSNQKYDKYFFSDNLILATKYKTGDLSKDVVKGKEYYTEYECLYSEDGKIIIGDGFLSINLENIAYNMNLNEVLIKTIDKNKKYSLLLYDKKLKKITNKFFEKSDFLKAKNEYSKEGNSVVYTFKDASSKVKQIKIGVLNNAIKLISTKDVDAKSELVQIEYVSYVNEITNESSNNVQNKTNNLDENNVNSSEIIEVNFKKDFNYSPKKNDEIFLKKTLLIYNNYYLKENNGKYGLFFVKNNKALFTQEYDQIIKVSSSGIDNFIMKNNNKYGCFFSGMGIRILIEPIFEKIPLVGHPNYFGKNQPLIKLFDENNKFFCYADKTGKLYYSEK